MKYLPLLLIAVSVIACKEKKEPHITSKNYSEKYHSFSREWISDGDTSECGYILPTGYKLLCSDVKEEYIIKNSAGCYLEMYNGQDPVFARYVTFSNYENVRKFADSCIAKNILKRYLRKQEYSRQKDSLQNIRDSVQIESQKIEHFKECTR